MMEHKLVKASFLGIVFIIGGIFTGIGIDNGFAQNATNGSATSLYPNNTETIQEFENIEGNNSAIFSNDTNISNPANNLENSLATNENQSN
ncbi:MAG: hypothetical protein M3162_06350 [Thermoproteota archaeon]|nr:hypothetical protein [Thermoproteota archaeon]